eukprot:NODE_175_length_14138_cov_1.015314.p11 type:complete len:139 gc:universal NODE_175_length_14138_cov_1.015314:8326-8742(+)
MIYCIDNCSNSRANSFWREILFDCCSSRTKPSFCLFFRLSISFNFFLIALIFLEFIFDSTGFAPTTFEPPRLLGGIYFLPLGAFSTMAPWGGSFNTKVSATSGFKSSNTAKSLSFAKKLILQPLGCHKVIPLSTFNRL